MLTLATWRWTHWILLLVGVLILTSYLGLLSWGPLEDAFRRLASQPGAREAFREPGGQVEALFIVLTFLLLTPVAALAVLFLMVLVLAILAGFLAPVARMFGLPDSTVTVLLVAGLAAVAYAERPLWLPWSRWVLGFVVRAFLVVLQ